MFGWLWGSGAVRQRLRREQGGRLDDGAPRWRQAVTAAIDPRGPSCMRESETAPRGTRHCASSLKSYHVVAARAGWGTKIYGENLHGKWEALCDTRLAVDVWICNSLHFFWGSNVRVLPSKRAFSWLFWTLCGCNLCAPKLNRRCFGSQGFGRVFFRCLAAFSLRCIFR